MNVPAPQPGPGELLLALPAGGRVLFTTRAHNNLSSVAGPHHEHGHRARERLQSELGLRGLARGHQVHGTTVRRIRACTDLSPHESCAPRAPVQADGHATAVPGIGIMALTADCLPVALGGHRGVAILHAGWRGLAGGVLEEGVRALRELDVRDIVAIVGPGAGPCCYEVGPDVHAALGSDVHPAPIDLKAIARDRLLACGVTAVHDLAICTICDHRFFSHRRQGPHAGRQAGIAWLTRSG